MCVVSLQLALIEETIAYIAYLEKILQQPTTAQQVCEVWGVCEECGVCVCEVWGVCEECGVCVCEVWGVCVRGV